MVVGLCSVVGTVIKVCFRFPLQIFLPPHPMAAFIGAVSPVQARYTRPMGELGWKVK